MGRRGPVKCQVEFGDNYGRLQPRIKAFPRQELANRVAEFVAFKEQNGPNTPFTKYGNDKSSAVNAAGRVIKRFAVNQVHHCHLGLNEAGDPLVLYKVLSTTSIVVICITDHFSAFNRRANFIQDYGADLPER